MASAREKREVVLRNDDFSKEERAALEEAIKYLMIDLEDDPGLLLHCLEYHYGKGDSPTMDRAIEILRR